MWGLETLKTSDAGIEFIKTYEEFRAEPYTAVEGGKLTIGYGHEIKEGESFTVISEAEAYDLLKKDLEWVEEGINKNYEGNIPLTQQQFDAMISLGINAGRSGLVNSDVFLIVKR